MFIFLPSLVFPEQRIPSVFSLEKEINALIYSGKFDSAQFLAMNFLEQKNLSDSEIFYGNYFLGDVFKSSGKTDEAIRQFQKCKIFLKKFQQEKLYTSLVYAKIAETYFDVSDFPEAKKYAQLSIQLNPDSSLRTGGHAVNFIILGYCDFLEKKYQPSLDFYNRSIEEYLKHGEHCELPLCYMKIAKVHNAMKNENESEKFIEKAVFISDSCKIKNYKLLSLYTILDIYKENKNFEDGLKTLEEINALVKEIGFEKQRQSMNELEVKYETKIAQAENENLKEINQKNNEILSQQKIVIAITVIAVLILSVLIFIIFRISVQQKKTLVEIREKNQKIKLQNDDLERLHQLNQKIFSVISHDFRGPIISLQLLLKALNAKNLDEEQISDYTQDLSHQLMQTKMVMENLLNWAKTELNVSAIRENFSSRPFLIAEEISEQQKSVSERKKIKTINRISENVLLQIPPDILRIVFRNLLSNAIKFSYENSEIIFDYDAANNLLLIKDCGVGIDEKKIKSLFSQDIQPSLGTMKESGFGFGLYITHELLHRFGGNIQAVKNEPEGTVLKITIPKVSQN